VDENPKAVAGYCPDEKCNQKKHGPGGAAKKNGEPELNTNYQNNKQKRKRISTHQPAHIGSRLKDNPRAVPMGLVCVNVTEIGVVRHERILHELPAVEQAGCLKDPNR
jgi:hypothetical protein